MSHDPDSRTALPRPGGPHDPDGRTATHGREPHGRDDGPDVLERAVRPASTGDASPAATEAADEEVAPAEAADEETVAEGAAARLVARAEPPAAPKTTG